MQTGNDLLCSVHVIICFSIRKLDAGFHTGKLIIRDSTFSS